MSRLSITLMAGLLWTGSDLTLARELPVSDPVRASLVDLARHAPAAGLPSDARLTLSRAWVDGPQAKVCALARRADGDLLIQDGRAQMKRVQLRKMGSKWAVEHAEHVVVGPRMTIDTACKQPSPDAIMAAAIKTLEEHPPTAGIKVPPSPAKSGCSATALAPIDSKPLSAPGEAALPGRSLLHTAPDTRCLMGSFIVQGDKVVILSQAPGWTQVRYTHPLTKVVTTGWLKREQVKQAAPGEQSVTATALKP